MTRRGARGSGIEELAAARAMCAPAPTEPSVLVLCLGNDIRGDDGVGWAVADALEAGDDAGGSGAFGPGPRTEHAKRADVVVRRSALSGFYLLDELAGYDRVVVVDAVQTGAHPAGTVLSFPFEALGTEAGPSPHAVGLPSVVRLGRQSGVPLPTRIHIVAIEVDDMASVAEGLSHTARASVPQAAGTVRALLARMEADVARGPCQPPADGGMSAPWRAGSPGT